MKVTLKRFTQTKNAPHTPSQTCKEHFYPNIHLFCNDCCNRRSPHQLPMPHNNTYINYRISPEALARSAISVGAFSRFSPSSPSSLLERPTKNLAKVAAKSLRAFTPLITSPTDNSPIHQLLFYHLPPELL